MDIFLTWGENGLAGHLGVSGLMTWAHANKWGGSHKSLCPIECWCSDTALRTHLAPLLLEQTRCTTHDAH
jgi:hypothetical protein